MTEPIAIDIPHRLGLAGVRGRIEGGIDKLAGVIPGGTMTERRWDGDTLHFTVQAMGQTVASRLDLSEDKVHAVVHLPPFLALFAERIRAKLAKDAPDLLR